jgi:transposase
MSISDHKHMPEPVRRIEVFTGAGRRRNWLPKEKAAIIAESYVGGETVCSVARRHGLTPQQLFTWRRLARGTRTAEAPPFVPAVAEMPAPAATKRSRRRRSSAAASIELEIDGVVVRVGPGAQASTVAAVIRALKVRS